MIGEIFISHSSRDNAYTRDLTRCLWEYGIPVWVDYHINPGTEWESELERRLAACRAVVVVVTVAALESEWVWREIHIAREQNKSLFPLLAQPGIQDRLDARAQRVLGAFQFEFVEERGSPSNEFIHRLRLVSGPRTAPQLLDVTHRSGTTIPHCPNRLPGRAYLLSHLTAFVTEAGEGTVIDLVGPGGVGKTSFARLLADVLGPHFEAVFWVSYLHPPDPLSYLPAILFDLGIEDIALPDSGSRTIVSAVVRMLRERRILIVFDNVDTVITGIGPERTFHPAHQTALTAARGRPGGSCLLFTSRIPLPPPVRASWLEKRLEGVDREAAERILDDVGLAVHGAELEGLVRHHAGNPFALIHAARTAHLTGSQYAGEKAGEISDSVARLIQNQLAAAPPAVRACLEYLAMAPEEPDHGELARVLEIASPGCRVDDVVQDVMARGWTSYPEARLAPVAVGAIRAQVQRQITWELLKGEIHTLRYLPLLPTQQPEGLRDRLKSELLDPVLAELRERGQDQTVKYLMNCLVNLEDLREDSYATGNVLNLLFRMEGELEPLHLAGSTIRNADFRDCRLPALDLRGARFADVLFDLDLEGITCLSFNPDGRRVAAGTANGDVHLVDARGREAMIRCMGHYDVVADLVFSDDSTFLATASDDGTARLWDGLTGKCLRELPYDDHSRLNAIDMTRDGRTIAAGGVSGTVFVWQNGELVRRLSIATPAGGEAIKFHIRGLAFNRSANLLACGCSDGRVRIWDWHAGKLLFVSESRAGVVESVSLAADSDELLASTPQPPLTRTFDLGRLKEAETPLMFRRAGTLMLSRDGSRAVNLRSDHLLELFDVSNGRKRDLPVPRYRLQYCDVNGKSGLIAAGGDSHSLSVWDGESGELVWTLMGFSRWIKAVDFSPDGSMIACCADDETIHVWDLARQAIVHTIRPHTGHIRHLRFIPGRGAIRVVSGSDDGYLVVSNLEDGSQRRFGPHEGGVWGVAASRDGKLIAAGCRQGQIRVWPLGASRSITLDGSAHVNVRSVAFSARGDLLASCGEDCRVRVWNLETRRCDPCTHHEGPAWSVDFSPTSRFTGDLIASSGEDGVVRVWSLARSSEVAVLKGHRDTVWSTRFSPDGRLIASASSDQSVRVWRLSHFLWPWTRRLGSLLRMESCKAVEPEHNDWARAVAFSRDGRHLASGSHDGSVLIHDLRRGGSSVSLPVLRPYEGLDVRDSRGLTVTQREALKRLGAVTG